MIPSEKTLTEPQNELFEWIRDYMNEFQHSPSIRQMMQAMGLKSPAPIQSRLKHLQDKGFIKWQEGKARTLQIVEDVFRQGIPILGSIAAGGLIETFNDFQEELDISSVIKKKGLFALIVNGDSMKDAFIADGDTVLLEPIESTGSIKNGTIVSAYIPGSGATLKYFYKKGNKVSLEAANPNYSPIVLENEQISIQGRLCAVWRKT
ncbi:SOS-response transcriptional repressor, LexA [Prochlorococcus marinus str. MIT 9312]|uniref:LexA repressor n=1 Tax=Prochlorococcus marinus (strain MIT 9312) TaxID=74546 RepID=Q319M9_PROM9|nr:transcriptional repressor LexA [Prochlorococcus marinus]ABB50416.1 SOS-response transcriptional repressor, LexA [Prochlorococcus marinus str. MIT 9312]KGF99785.1 SOS-response repressor and protease LexA [Prochlorococcus marinus str. MIT 9311]